MKSAAFLLLAITVVPLSGWGKEPVPQFTFKDWKPVERTTEKIALVEEKVMGSGEDSWKLKFYRNTAYKCGLSGHYTFVIIEPRNAPGKEAPHEFLVVNAGHVPTVKKDGHPVHDQVDAFIKRAMKRNPNSPFKAMKATKS